MTKEEFNTAVKPVIRRALACSEKARREGLLALEDEFDTLEDRFWKKGLRLMVDGFDAAFIAKVLSNKIEQEEDPYVRRLMTIKKEACLGIQDGMNTRALLILLDSYTDGSAFEALKEEGQIGGLRL